MSRCVNCGKRIRPNGEIQLCDRCAACETMYDVLVVKLRRQILLAIRSFVIYVCIAAVAYYSALFPASKTIGFVLFYFAIASTLLSIAMCLSQYVQLRQQVKRESADQVLK